MTTGFQVGGTVSTKTSFYLKRDADDELYQYLLEGELCYAFNSRQMGKSSLLLSVKTRLQDQGVFCSFIDLSRIGSVGVSQQQWYAGIVSELWRGFNLPPGKAMFEWWQELGELPPSQKLSLFIEDKLVQAFPDNKITIFFDEIDSVLSLPFAADDFFSLIRAFYNKRADDRDFKRLSFAFFGVALPSDLMKDAKRSPFNIGKAIKLEGFTFDEALPLTVGLKQKDVDSKKIIERVLFWSNGQPLLTQKICRLLSLTEQGTSNTELIDWVDECVNDNIIDNWESHDNPEHIKTIRDRLLHDQVNTVQHLTTFLQILESPHNEIEFDAIKGFNRLYLTGLVANIGNKVTPRSKIYQTIFNKKWLAKHLAQCRPYGQKLSLWQKSNQEDEQWLLPSTDLASARAWGQDKHLAEEDYQFFTASQEKVNQAMQSWNLQLQSEVEQRKAAQTALKEALKEVELAKAQAVQANQAKSEFLERVSHEVRTHLNSILGISYIGQQQEYSQKGNTPLGRINRVATYMHGIVNDMLDIERLEKNQLTLTKETFYIDDVIDKLITIISPQIENKKLSLQVNFPNQLLPAYIGDPLRLMQLLSNLLTNAVKYTRDGGVIVNIGLLDPSSADNIIDRTTHHRLVFDVIDSGVGIDDYSFDGVYKEVSSDKIKQGVGLKLCSKLADLMDGTLSLKTKPQQGCHFSFSVPLSIVSFENETQALNINNQNDIDVDHKSKKVLLVESELTLPLKQQLSLLGHQVVSCSLKDITQPDLPHFDVIIAASIELQEKQPFIQQLDNNPQLHMIPLLKQSEIYPNWLNSLGFKYRLNYPCSTRHIAGTLNSITLETLNVHAKEEILPFEQSRNELIKNAYKVLVVDDDEINQEIVTELLTSIGLSVDVAENGLAALDAIKTQTYELVLMDIEMPVMGGEQAFKEIQALAKQPSYTYLATMPVIALTAHALLDDKKKYLRSGMSDYIGKPIEPDLLISIVKQWLPNGGSDVEVESIDNFKGKHKALNVTSLEMIGLNVSEGLMRCNDNYDLYVKILRQFCHQYSEGISFTDESLTITRQLVHALKGSAGNIGLKLLSTQAQNLEQQLNNAIKGEITDNVSFEKFSDKFHLLNEQLIKVCAEILSRINTQKLKETNVIEKSHGDDDHQVKSLLNQLLIAIEDDHNEAMLLTEKLMHITDKAAGKRGIEINNAMNQFEIDLVKTLSQEWIDAFDYKEKK